VRADVFDRAAAPTVAAAAPDVVIHQLTDLAEATDGCAGSAPATSSTRPDAGVERIVVQSMAFPYEPGTPGDESTPSTSSATRPSGDARASSPGGHGQGAAGGGRAAVRPAVGPGTWYAPGGPIAAALAGRPGARSSPTWPPTTR